MDMKEECERSDKIILETWNASRTKMDRIQICNNKVSYKKPGKKTFNASPYRLTLSKLGRWVTANKICLKFYSDNVNTRKNRMAEFAGGRMKKSDYKVIRALKMFPYFHFHTLGAKEGNPWPRKNNAS